MLKSSSLSSRQRYQYPSLQRPRTRRLDCLPRVDNPILLHLQCPKLFGDVMSSYAAVDGELHAGDYTGMSSYRPIVHMEAMIMQ